MNYFLLYLIMCFDSIIAGLSLLLVFNILYLVIAFLCKLLEDAEELIENEGIHFVFLHTKKAIACLIVTSILLVSVPTTKQAIAIYSIPKISNISGVDQLPENVVKFLNSYLKDNVKDEEKK